MQTKLQELTEKIYQEGVTKAKDEAELLKAENQKLIDEMLEKAEKDAENIIKDAEKKADELKTNTEKELQLFARQAMSDLKQKIATLIEFNALHGEINQAIGEGDFIKEIIETIVKNWNPHSSDRVDLKVLLPENKRKELESFFSNKAKDILDKGAEINFDTKLKSGFQIGPKDGSYLISFSDEDFENFFKSYLRPKLIELLFAQK